MAAEDSSWVPHPKYYDPDCPYPTFQAGNVRFKFMLPPFRLLSAYASSMVSGGGTFDNGEPIILANLTAEDFENVLSWLWHESWQPTELKLPHLVSLLRSSRYLMMPSLARWALARIQEFDPPMSPVQKLVLSQELPLLKLEWLRPSVGALLLIELDTFNSLQSSMTSLHTQIILKLLSAREMLRNERIILAYTQLPDNIPPAIGCDPIRHSTICFPVWRGLWWNQIARRLLHPELDRRVDRISDMPAMLRGIQWEGITTSCVDSFISSLEGAGAFTVEAEIVTAATTAVRDYLSTLHMNPHEFEFHLEQEEDDRR